MTVKFPNDIYEPREMENLNGLELDATDTKNLYAEDYNDLTGEVVSIEETLGENPQGVYATVKAWLEALSAGGSSVWGAITGTLSNQTDLQNALNAKQNSLGFTPENVANKKTDLTSNSDTYYPSQKAVKTAVDAVLAYIYNILSFFWIDRKPAGNVDKSWLSVSSDSDGSNLIAGLFNGRLYTSSDSGVSWTERQPAGNVDKTWYSVSSDSDGSNLIACADVGRLYTSSDSGVSWIEQMPAGNVNKNWRSVSSDSDGSNLIACANAGRLYTTKF